MRDYLLICGTWIFADAWYSLFLYSDKHEALDSKYSTIKINQMSKVAVVTLNNTMDEEMKRNLDIKGTARHEAIHLLISRLEWIAGCRYIGEEEIDEEVESLTVRLEGLIP